jgi:hypothetical protein
VTQTNRSRLRARSRRSNPRSSTSNASAASTSVTSSARKQMPTAITIGTSPAGSKPGESPSSASQPLPCASTVAGLDPTTCLSVAARGAGQQPFERSPNASGRFAQPQLRRSTTLPRGRRGKAKSPCKEGGQETTTSPLVHKAVGTLVAPGSPAPVVGLRLDGRWPGVGIARKRTPVRAAPVLARWTPACRAPILDNPPGATRARSHVGPGAVCRLSELRRPDASRCPSFG